MTVLDYSAFQRALAQLAKSYDYLHSDLADTDPELRNMFRAAAIQAFEYTYELGLKMVRRQLEQIVANPAGLREMAFMDLMRSAAEAGLIRGARPFKAYREMRNITSHTYNADRAEEVVSVVEGFLRDMRFLLDELRKRNRGTD